MDPTRFDDLARSFAAPASRRATLRAVVGGLVAGSLAAALGAAPAAAVSADCGAICRRLFETRAKQRRCLTACKRVACPAAGRCRVARVDTAAGTLALEACGDARAGAFCDRATADGAFRTLATSLRLSGFAPAGDPAPAVEFFEAEVDGAPAGEARPTPPSPAEPCGTLRRVCAGPRSARGACAGAGAGGRTGMRVVGGRAGWVGSVL